MGNPIRFSKILIVDDSVSFRYRIRSILSDAKIGYYFYEANDGKEAVSQYIANKPDVVIMDIVMPNISGLTAIRAIKKYDLNSKIIVASTQDNKELVDTAIKVGAKDYIIKPFNPGIVVMAVSKQLLLKRNYKNQSKTMKQRLKKPLMHHGEYHGYVVNETKGGELELSINNDRITNNLINNAKDVKNGILL